MVVIPAKAGIHSLPSHSAVSDSLSISYVRVLFLLVGRAGLEDSSLWQRQNMDKVGLHCGFPLSRE